MSAHILLYSLNELSNINMIGLYEIDDGRSNCVYSDLPTNKSLNFITGDQYYNILVFLGRRLSQ